MKLLLKKTIGKLGAIGEVVEVKNGYARNYLLPQGLAVEPTEANLRAIETEKQAYLAEQATQREQMRAQAAAISGKEITMAALANEEGHLYGSIGPAQICEALAAENIFLDPEHIALDEPIRQLDKYDITVRFADDITAQIHVWIVPMRGEDEPGTEDGLQTAPAAEADSAAMEAAEPTDTKLDVPTETE